MGFENKKQMKWKKCMHAENKGSIHFSGHTKKFLKLIFTVFLFDA